MARSVPPGSPIEETAEPSPEPHHLRDESLPRGTPGSPRQRVGFVLGPLVFLAVLVLPTPGGMSPEAWHTTAIGLLMAIWWVTEPIPIPATSLLPLVLFPLLGVLSIRDAATPYANPVIFLFLGGFILALAMERWNLHRRIALRLVKAVGVQPHALVLGIMVATGFLSMWVSNTATTVMMLPIGISIISLVRPEAEYGDGTPVDFNFAVCLLLGIAYAASIGGLGTLIGTPPNALLAGFVSESYGVEIGFAQWMIVGVPLAFVGLPLAWLLLTRAVFPIRIQEIPGGRASIEREYRNLGPISAAERWVAVVFASTAVLWITRPLLQGWLPGLDDAAIAVAAALVLFMIPHRGTEGERGGFLMDWQTAVKLPWDVLLLFGGGLSLAEAVRTTGLAEWIGGAVGSLDVPKLAMILLVTVIIVFLTELTSNTATAAAFLPVVGGIAIGLGENPFLLIVPAAIAASCAFMFPVATPPNAIVYGSGYLSIPQMVRAGWWLNILFIGLTVVLVYTLVPVVFGIEPGVLPPWATSAAR